MLFNTTSFVLFFVAFYLLFSFVFRSRTARLWLIIVCSVFFYGCWDYRFVPLLLGTGIVDFYLARRIHDEPSRPKRFRWLLLSVGMNLGVLAFFKYTNFLLGNVRDLGALVGARWHPPTLSVVLPVGVSFYTFQSISYTIDVYRGSFRPRKQLDEFLAALTFFPHLVAGPIVRSSFLLPQFATLNGQSWELAKRGFLLVALGIVKKTVADRVGPTADAIFGHAGPQGAIESWTGALAFTCQVFGDFAGYSDIATGIALLLGVQLPPNFSQPYLATSPAQFWHRWHISLSTWLRDYLWLPLSIKNTKLPPANLLMTMLLGGLWHGASWTFVVWGGYHGLLLVVNHELDKRWPKTTHRALVVPKVLLTFYLVTVGWVVFRATSLKGAWAILRGMHAPVVASAGSRASVVTLAMVALAIAFLTAVDSVVHHKRDTLEKSVLLWPVVLLGLAIGFIFDAGGRAFIYFQF